MLYQGHRFLGGIKHFWMAVRVWKTNLVVEDLALQKRTKMWPKLGISWGLSDIWVGMISSVLNLNRQNVHDSEKGFITSGQRLRTLGCCIMTMLPITLPSLWTNFRPKKGISVVPQPPYSPDLSPCDFFLFPKLKFHLKGRYFGTVDNIQKFVTDQLRAFLHEDFQHCYREWEQCLQRCVASQGNYFEGENVDL